MDKLDYLSPKTTFYRNSNSSHSSSFGGCLTFCNGIVGIGLFFFFGLDLFFRESPEVSTSVAVNDSPRIDQIQFSPAVAMMYVGGASIKEIHRKLNFTLTVAEIDASREIINTSTHFDLEPCDKTRVFKENANQLKKGLIAVPESYFCIPDEVEYSIEGVYGSTKFKLINIEVSYCSSSPDCYSEQFIRTNLTEIFFHALFNDYYVDAFDFASPVKESVSKILNPVSSGFSQTFNLNFREIDFHNQEGWVFSQNTLTTRHSFNSNDFSVSDLNNKKEIINVSFIFDNFKQIYKRSYIKVQDILAQVAGAIKVTNIGFRLLVAVYSYFRLNGERMLSFSSQQPRMLVEYSSQNNFVTPNIQVGANQSRPTFSFFTLLTMRAKIAEFNRFYKRILSEQNIFELCVLHEIKKKDLTKKSKIAKKIKHFVETKGLVSQANSEIE